MAGRSSAQEVTIRNLSLNKIMSTDLVHPSDSKCFSTSVMKLPADCTDLEFKVAWNANGRHTTPLNAKSVITALIEHLRATHQVPLDVARKFASERFPDLWKESSSPAQQMSPALPPGESQQNPPQVK
jgi:hypothetical protein